MDVANSTSNGSKASADTTDKSRKGGKQKRYLPSLPSSSSANEMSKAEYSGLVDKTAVEWRSLKNYEMFSLSPDGLFPMLKVSRSKAVRLADREVMMVGSGRCHRILLSSH